MEVVGVRRPERINNRHLGGLQTDGVNDERITLVMADRFPVPGGCRVVRMITVKPNPTHLVIALIDDDDPIVRLHELNLFEQVYDLWYARRPAGIVRRVDMVSADFGFCIFLHDLACPRLQDRIVEISSPDVVCAGAIDFKAANRLAPIIVGDRIEPGLPTRFQKPEKSGFAVAAAADIACVTAGRTPEAT
jgi:hypothetical protein